MKVSYILEGMKRGWLTYEVDALRDIGVEIEIHPNNPVVYGDMFKDGFSDRRHFVLDLFNAVRVLSRRPTLALRLFYKMKGYAGWRIALTTLSMSLRITGGGSNLLHAHFSSGPAATARAVSRLTGIPFGFTAHAYDLFKEPVDYEFLKQKCRDAAFVRCISEFNRRYILENTGLDGENFHTIPCGVDTNRFSPDSMKRKEVRKEKVILTVASLIPPKGLSYLLDALSDPAVKRLGYRSIILGDGPMNDELVRKARDLGVDVDFMGGVPNEEIGNFYRSSEIFVLPCVTASDGHHDGLPVVLMEAMASGLPVISSDISGIPELIEDGVSGILVPEKDTAALSRSIYTLLTERGLREKFSVEGRKKVVEKFEIRDIARRLKGLFSEHQVTVSK